MFKIDEIMKKILLLLLIVFVSSCNLDPDPVEERDLSIVNYDLKANQAMEDLDFLTMSALESNGIGMRTLEDPLENICKGIIITSNQQTKKITLDFGTGCKSKDGIERKGKVQFAYSGSLLLPGSKVVTSFEEFEVNGLKIQGTRTLSNGGFNLLAGSIILNVTVQEGKITWPDGKFITLDGNQTRSIKMSGSSYEVSITGTNSGISTDGSAYKTTISAPLEIYETCAKTGVYVPSKGTMIFTDKFGEFTLSFGTGTCDKIISVIYPGGNKDITLD